MLVCPNATKTCVDNTVDILKPNYTKRRFDVESLFLQVENTEFDVAAYIILQKSLFLFRFLLNK